jgi:hypothetical protein
VRDWQRVLSIVQFCSNSSTLVSKTKLKATHGTLPAGSLDLQPVNPSNERIKGIHHAKDIRSSKRHGCDGGAALPRQNGCWNAWFTAAALKIQNRTKRGVVSYPPSYLHNRPGRWKLLEN